MTNLQDIKHAVDKHNDNEEGEKGVFFVEQKHLPSELFISLNEIEDFQRFVKLIAFSEVTYELKIVGRGLPHSISEGSEARHTPCPGFPVTKPVEDAKVDLEGPYSFGKTELEDFLGKFERYAGNIIFLSLPPSGPILPHEYKEPVRYFTEILKMNSKRPT
ncbi:MAG: hypothetical protein V3T21_01890 [Candidatus Margulisiibacteriota bacterium]